MYINIYFMQSCSTNTYCDYTCSPSNKLKSCMKLNHSFCSHAISYTIAPSPPSIISSTSSTTTLTIKWDNGGYNYRLHVQKKGSTEIRMFGPVTPPYNITGLESNTEYTVVVEAYSLAGNANKSKVAYTLPECENYY